MAYTPGLRVSPRALIRRERRLPLRGEVLVSVGDTVDCRQVVARTELPGKVFTLNASGHLNVLEADLPKTMLKAEGDAVLEGEALAETAGLFGWFKLRLEAPVAGTLEAVSARTGRVMLRAAPTPVEVRAYVAGRVAAVHPGEGCTVETTGAICQGIFGIGGEVHGPLRVVAGPDEVPGPEAYADAGGTVAVGGRRLTREAFEAAREAGVAAIVCGGLDYADIASLVGHEIGVAITGSEALGTTLVLTEGFGAIAMAGATYELLRSLEGRNASVNGATQIRAGVIRPEILVPTDDELADEPTVGEAFGLEARVRIIRAPHFGALGRIVELPVELATMPSETRVRVLVAELDDGRRVTLPRANVELIEER